MEAAESVAVIPHGELTEVPGAGCSVFLVGEEKVGKVGKSPPSLCSDKKLWLESESEDIVSRLCT